MSSLVVDRQLHQSTGVMPSYTAQLIIIDEHCIMIDSHYDRTNVTVLTVLQDAPAAEYYNAGETSLSYTATWR